jgi:hypothetical protein
MAVLRLLWLCVALVPITAPADAQSTTPGGMPPPPGMSLAESTAMRFPQPVRVGDLLHKDVLRPVASQQVLGHVRAVVRAGDGTIKIVMSFGGFLGIDTRQIAVPVDAMVLVGQDMEVDAFTPKQLAGFPTFTASGTTPVPQDTIIRVGLAKPSH